MDMAESRKEWLATAHIDSLLNTFGANATAIANLAKEKQERSQVIVWQAQVRNEIIRRTQV